jgi:hypothetical protein
MNKNVQEIVDTIDFEKIKLVKKTTNDNSDAVKYFNFDYYFSGKYEVAKVLNLINSPKKYNILDISTGFGHFPYICKVLGHNVVVTDKPNKLYDQITQALGLTKVHYTFTKDPISFPKLPLQFDLITAFAVVSMSLFDFTKWDEFFSECIRISEIEYTFCIGPNQGGINSLEKYLKSTNRYSYIYDKRIRSFIIKGTK